jgi:hypothetical protein
MKYFAIILCTIIPALTFAEEIPFRKSGLWDIEMKNNDDPIIKMKQCVDAASEKETLEASKRLSEDKCTKSETHKEADTYITETDCTLGNRRVLTTTVTTGDFSSHYRSDITVQSIADNSDRSGSKIILNANWIGECEPGQKPGQMIMSNNG